jgi:hypothetical protein
MTTRPPRQATLRTTAALGAAVLLAACADTADDASFDDRTVAIAPYVVEAELIAELVDAGDHCAAQERAELLRDRAVGLADDRPVPVEVAAELEVVAAELVRQIPCDADATDEADDPAGEDAGDAVEEDGSADDGGTDASQDEDEGEDDGTDPSGDDDGGPGQGRGVGQGEGGGQGQGQGEGRGGGRDG